MAATLKMERRLCSGRSTDGKETRLNVSSHTREQFHVYDGLILPKFIPPSCVDGIRQFKVRDSDTYIITWPKSGTMWTSYIVTQILRGQEYADSHVLDDSAIFMEFPQNPGAVDGIHSEMETAPPLTSAEHGQQSPYQDKNTEGKYKSAAAAPSSRLFRTHFPIRCLPEDLVTSGAKVVYVARNPKDVAVSSYYFCLMSARMPNYASWDEYFDHFCEGLVSFGDWFEHVLPAWEQRDHPNVLFLKYEDMKRDLKGTVGVLSDFLEKPLTEAEVEEICNKSTFKMMKANDKVNPDKIKVLVPKTMKGKDMSFMRKGQVGDWKNLLTVAQSERLDDIIRRKTEGTGLEFTFE